MSAIPTIHLTLFRPQNKEASLRWERRREIKRAWLGWFGELPQNFNRVRWKTKVEAERNRERWKIWISWFSVSQEMNPLGFSNNFIKDLNFFSITFGCWQVLLWVWHEPSHTSKGQTEGCSKKGGSTGKSPEVVLQEEKLKEMGYLSKITQDLGV